MSPEHSLFIALNHPLSIHDNNRQTDGRQKKKSKYTNHKVGCGAVLFRDHDER